MVRFSLLVFNGEKNEANDLGTCVVNGPIVYACQALVDKLLNYMVKQLNYA